MTRATSLPPVPALVAGAVGAALYARHVAVRAGVRRRVRAQLATPAGAGARDVRLSRGPAPAVVALAAAGLAGAWVTAGPPTAVALAALAAAVPVVDRIRRHGVGRHARAVQLPEALDRMATALRAGSSLTMALAEVGQALDAPLGPEIAGLAVAAERGRSLPDVLDEWSSRHDDPGTRLAATALVLASVVGTAPARAVDGVAATLRERLDLAAERRALAVQARTSALVLSVAPGVFASLLVVADTAAARFLLRTPAGWACLGVGLGLDVLGAWWMARLSRSDGW
jgi:tight adherence protein B